MDSKKMIRQVTQKKIRYQTTADCLGGSRCVDAVDVAKGGLLWVALDSKRMIRHQTQDKKNIYQTAVG